MTYSNKTLARIGREVIEHHPHIATSILEHMPAACTYHLEEIPVFFRSYCVFIGVDPEKVTGPVFKSSITEIKKVFISAMVSIYNDEFLLKKNISRTLGQYPSATCRMINEVKVRYRKDAAFTEKVNNILSEITKSHS